MIRVDISGAVELTQALGTLREAVAHRVIVRALERAGKAMKTQANAEVREQLNLKVRHVDRALSVSKPHRSRPNVALIVQHEATGLGRYAAKRVAVGRGFGVSVKVKARGSRKVVRHGAFAIINAGGAVIFRRTSHDRLPIEKLFGPEPYQVIGRNKIALFKIQKAGRKTLEARFAHEWQREVARAAARGGGRL
jgi:hypothetical protein